MSSSSPLTPTSPNTTPHVSLNGSIIPLDKNVKILGATWDTHLYFWAPHAAIAARASKHIEILKALAGFTWGQDRKTLLLTWKALIKPILDYCAPIFKPNTSATNIQKLQVMQNSAL
jgi:hypothetical protein